eukprot:scaffold99586_cov58-Phaeocystis_antarctica.AAC.1
MVLTAGPTLSVPEVARDVRHGRVGELPARLSAARSDGAPLHARRRPLISAHVLVVGWDLSTVGEAGAHGCCGRLRVGWHHRLDSATDPGLLKNEDEQGRGYEVAAHGEAEQARQTEQRLAVRARLAFGVLEGLVLVGTDAHDDRSSSAVAVHGVTRLEHAAWGLERTASLHRANFLN